MTKMMKKRKGWNEVGIFRIFKLLNGITDFLLWKWFGKLFRSKWLFSWMSVRWILRLPDSENDLEHSLQGRGGIFFLNGFSPKMASICTKWANMPRKCVKSARRHVIESSIFNCILYWQEELLGGREGGLTLSGLGYFRLILDWGNHPPWFFALGTSQRHVNYVVVS